MAVLAGEPRAPRASAPDNSCSGPHRLCTRHAPLRPRGRCEELRGEEPRTGHDDALPGLADQKPSAETTSPPLRLPSACHAATLIESLMNPTCPSQNREFAPPRCRLRDVTF